jgi:RNA polymerase sigma-70 factor (ECF subfamily)
VSGDGDEKERFKAVVLPHLADAYTLARWLTGSRADAEDVVQDACLRAFRAISTYAGGNARAWVLTIVRNTAYTWLGKNRGLVLVEDIDALEQARGGVDADASHTETPETALIAKADAAQLDAAIAALPAPFREALVLREIHDLDYREIASVTGVPVGTVMSRLARARHRLMVVLGGKS